MSKSIIFLVKLILGNFYRHLAIVFLVTLVSDREREVVYVDRRRRRRRWRTIDRPTDRKIFSMPIICNRSMERKEAWGRFKHYLPCLRVHKWPFCSRNSRWPNAECALGRYCSVTRFAEISPLWQKNKSPWAIFWIAYLVFSKLLYHCSHLVTLVGI